MDKFYTTKEVAEFLEVTPGTVRDWIHKGKLKAKKGYRGQYWIEMSELFRFAYYTKLKYHSSLYQKHASYKVFCNLIMPLWTNAQMVKRIRKFVSNELEQKKKEES